jgi:tetratricopeptide (TPR) repeat protein
VDPDSAPLRIWTAREHLKAGRFERARALLSEVDARAVTDPGVYFDFAALLINRSRPAEAIEYLDRAIALDAGFVEGIFRRGLAYLQMGRLGEARRDLRRVVEIATESEQGRMAREALDKLN